MWVSVNLWDRFVMQFLRLDVFCLLFLKPVELVLVQEYRVHFNEHYHLYYLAHLQSGSRQLDSSFVASSESYT